MALKKDVFKTWREEQDVYARVTVSSMKKYLGNRNFNNLRRKFITHLVDLQTMAALFVPDFGDMLAAYKLPLSKELIKYFEKIYSLLDGDTKEFVKYLEERHFVSKRVNSVENRQGVTPVVKKYSTIFDILFNQEDDDKEDEFLFTVANRFFEFCFVDNFVQFKKMINNSEYHPIIRLLYSVMWSNLAEIGWQHWHADTLKLLKKHANQGKEVVYIAGGTDIYQLIKHGVYNIRVIDPLLPSQPKYYSQGWEWFITGKGDSHGIGERMTIPVGGKKIVMERADFKYTGPSIKMKLSTNKTVTIKESVTTWHLYDGKKLLGKVFFERRLTNQDDFKFSSKQTVLISFNELYFVAAPKAQDGWGINPNLFSDKLQLVIKQLERPVNKRVACNIRYEVKQSDFAFISLGSCVD